MENLFSVLIFYKVAIEKNNMIYDVAFRNFVCSMVFVKWERLNIYE